MHQRERELSEAFQCFGQKKFNAAEALCLRILSRSPADADAMHLLGLVRKDTGKADEGEQLLISSIQMAPGRADFRANLANLLVRQGRLPQAEQRYREALAIDPRLPSARLGLARALVSLSRPVEAEEHCRSLLSANSRDAQAWSTLGAALRDQDRFREAETAFRRAIELQPEYAAAHHNLGALLSRLERAEESIERLEHASRLGVKGFELSFNRGRALLQLARLDEAELAFADAVALQPQNIEAQLNLAKLRHMRGDPRFARDIAAAVAVHRNDTALQMLFGDVLRRSGDLQGAEILLRDLLSRLGPVASVRSALATVLHEAGRLQEAEAEARAAAAEHPDDGSTAETLVAVLLSRGDAEGAWPLILRHRQMNPRDQRWIAYQATAARVLGNELYSELYDYDRFIRIEDLDPPPGWRSQEELNAALLQTLKARHRFAAHPLDQSLRHGSQTARSLLADPDPAIQAALSSFERAVERYRAQLGADPVHPLTGRNQGTVALVGCWSVRLHRAGFHFNHVHPQGWISSAYYVATPQEVEDQASMSGWLKFGEPRFAVPGCTPERFVQPRPGRLVLFPSYMWHGTTPIHGDEPRITIAFDAAPLG